MPTNSTCQHCAAAPQDDNAIHVFAYDLIIGDMHYLCETDDPMVFCNMKCFSDFIGELQQLGDLTHGSQKPS